MAIQRDLSDLPRPTQTEGVTPDPSPRFVTALVDELALRPRKPKAADTLSRYSSAAVCIKRTELLARGVEPEPMDLAGLHVTNIGTLIHEAWQASLGRKYADEPGEWSVQFETKTSIEDLTSGASDAVLTFTDDANVMHREVLELKTTGGFGYKLMVGERGNAQGPKAGHIVQLALNVMALDADRGTLIYLTNEAISKGIAERKGFDEVTRFGAEWSFTREQLQPHADEELARLREIQRRMDAGERIPRFVPYEMPKGAEVRDVDKSQWTLTDGEQVTDTGSVWGGSYCAYCPVREACREELAAELAGEKREVA